MKLKSTQLIMPRASYQYRKYIICWKVLVLVDKKSKGANGGNSCHTITKWKQLKLSLSCRKPLEATEVKDGC